MRRPFSAAAESVCPAKVNIILAVTGRRDDGFHDLVSLVVQTEFGDHLSIEAADGADRDTLAIDGSNLEADAANLVLRAAQAFRARAPELQMRFFRFRLSKRIPIGAGFGGGSSDAAGALRLLNGVCSQPLTDAELIETAAGLGSDCPLFLHRRPVVMRGRGELLSAVPPSASGALQGQRLLLFKPGFAVPTPWAYAALAARAAYTPGPAAEALLKDCLSNAAAMLVHNDFEAVVAEKFPTLHLVLEHLRTELGVTTLLSGSGSGCFARISSDRERDAVRSVIREAWGDDAFCVETRVCG